jgi:hypothetical protein
MTIASEEVATFFEPSIKATVEAILTLAKDSPVDIAVSNCDVSRQSRRDKPCYNLFSEYTVSEDFPRAHT